MAEKADLLQIEITAATQGSSRESSPDEHRMSAMQQQHSMESLILSGESSDDILIDYLDDEEAMGSCGEDEEGSSEAMAATEAGLLNRVTMVVAEGADQSVISADSTGAGGGHDTQEAVGQLTRNKKKRRISRARERKISISSSRLKVFNPISHSFLVVVQHCL